MVLGCLSRGMILAGVTLFAAGTVPATTYYVSTNGVDTNPGTLAAPWRTIQQAANTLAPGDTALVRGGIYNEAITVKVSGTATAGPVTFQNYPGETAVVDGTGLVVPPAEYAAGLFEFTNASYVVVHGFEIRNYQANSTALVPAGIDITGAPHDLTFISNRVHDIANLNTTAGANAYGIAVHGTLPAAISNLVFLDNEVYSNITGQSETFSFDGNCNGFTVGGNLVHDNNNIGIDFIGYEGVCSDPNQDYARNGVCRSNLVWNISNNANPAYPANDDSAGGIYVDGGSNVLVELNLVHNCDIGVELASEHQGHATIGCICRDNLIWSNNTQGISIGGYSTSVGQTWNCLITHNTLYQDDTKHVGDGELYIQYNALTNAFQDNIVDANSQDLLIGSAGFSKSTNTTVADWNLYFAPGGTNGSTWQWNKDTYASFGAYQAGTTNDLHSIFADPMFISVSNANFHISHSSPAFNGGDPGFQSVTNASGETDIDLQPRIAFGRTDIGADELNLLSPTLGITLLAPGSVLLQLAGEPGHSFGWQQSGTLANWLSFLTNSSSNTYLVSTNYIGITNSTLAAANFFRAQMIQ